MASSLEFEQAASKLDKTIYNDFFFISIREERVRERKNKHGSEQTAEIHSDG